MGLLKSASVLDICDAQVQHVEMGSNVVEFDVRNITVEPKDQGIAVDEKSINVVVSIHSSKGTRARFNKTLGSARGWFKRRTLLPTCMYKMFVNCGFCKSIGIAPPQLFAASNLPSGAAD